MPQDYVNPQAQLLTELQLKCLEGFWNRKTAKRIAVDLGISEAWVNKNLLAVRKQLNVNSTAEAARIVFSGGPGGSKNYYYQETSVPELAPGSNQSLAPTQASALDGVASERALINRLGPLVTVVGITLVGLGSITGVSILIVVAQGMNQLWKALGY